MTDFGLGDDIVNEDVLYDALKWHGLLDREVNKNARQPLTGIGIGQADKETQIFHEYSIAETTQNQ